MNDGAKRYNPSDIVWFLVCPIICPTLTGLHTANTHDRRDGGRYLGVCSGRWPEKPSSSADKQAHVSTHGELTTLPQGLKLVTKPNLLGISMGGFISLTSAALYGDYYGSVIVVGGAAGGPYSKQPSSEVYQKLKDPYLTPAGLLNLSFPLQFPSGVWGLSCLSALLSLASKIILNPLATSSHPPHLAAVEAACKFHFETDFIGPQGLNGTTYYRQMGAMYTYVSCRVVVT